MSPAIDLPKAEAIKAQGGGLKGAALAALDLAGERRKASRKAQECLVDAESAAEQAACLEEAATAKDGTKDGLVAGANIALVLGTLLAAPVLAILIGLGDI